jgi:hypothetical protein
MEGAPALTLKLSVDPTKGYAELRKILGTNVDTLDEIFGLLKRQFNVDVSTQLIPTLDGNIAWAVYETPPSLLRKPELTALMRSGRTTFSLGLRDRSAFLKIFDGVVDGAGGFVKKTDEGGVPVYTFEDIKPVARLAVGEKVAVLAGAKISSLEAVSLAAGKGKPASGALVKEDVKALLSSTSMTGLLLDPNQLTKIVGETRAASPFEGIDMLLLTLQPNEHGGVADLKLAFKPEGKEGSK